MAYREVRLMDTREVIRRWLSGEAIRAIARATGLDRKTIRRLLAAVQQSGLQPGDLFPDDTQLAAIIGQFRRPVRSTPRQTEQTLRGRQPQIQTWLKEGLLLTKVHELLCREGFLVTYSSLYRFARKWCDFGSSSLLTVRRAPVLAGEMAEVDFGRLGLLHDLANNGPRVLHAFIMILGYSRLSCVIPTFRQDLPSVIDCFEEAFRFFEGCPRRVVIDNLKCCIDAADSYTPRLNRTFLEYTAFRGFLADPARSAHPQDKPVVENHVRYVRERFFKGETFLNLEDVARRALLWCRQVAGNRIHGTTRQVPLLVFETEEKGALLPLTSERFDTPRWAVCKVHPDHHVRFDCALYSLPTRFVGKSVDLRADRALVRIYSGAELIKTHPRQPRGGRSTDYSDYPSQQAPYAMRYQDYYRKLASQLGSSVGTFAAQLLAGEFPWSRLRQAQKLLTLAERYGATRLEAACARALRFDLIDVHRLERILQQALEQYDDSDTPIQGSLVQTPLKFLRPADHFAHPTYKK